MLPSRVDCIIIGTGLVNSIFAAACSRIGKTVLHLDKNSYYGDDWASFTFQQLLDWIKRTRPQDNTSENAPEELLRKSRMFCIDLCPKLLLSEGPMVDLLVKSNVSRYHEFKNNIRILSIIDDEIHVIPCQRSEVFTSPLLSNLTDKRKLMKFIESCIKFSQDHEKSEETSEIEVKSPNQDSEININAQKPISEYLEERGLKKTLREYIINSLAMVKPTDPTSVACQNIKKFMSAIQRYGRSPFLMPMYGCGEFPQSFCRLSAVFGGVYCLNDQFELVNGLNPNDSGRSEGHPPAVKRPARKLENTEDSFSVVLTNSKHEVKSDKLVVDYNYGLGLDLIEQLPLENKLSRAILITKESIVPSDDENISFLRIPPSDKNKTYVHLLEFNSSVMVCPKGLNIVYLWTQASSEEPESDLRMTVDRLYSGDKACCIVWKFYYHQLTTTQKRLQYDDKITGLHITCPPSSDIDYEDSISEAQQLFDRMFPGEDFLPRAPDPDEIVST